MSRLNQLEKPFKNPKERRVPAVISLGIEKSIAKTVQPHDRTTSGYSQNDATIYAGHDLAIAAGQINNTYGNTATQGGVPYNQLIKVGGWELKFSPPRQPGQLPALIHALHTGK
ncbi:hypothetical protein [Burkholderia multivorans]|uniref:hypothetical protein n=1 Tax=Burkholderia multivorans TaxID=87883 RepID=UPI00345EBA02